MNRRGPFGARLWRTAGWTLGGGAVFTWLVHWSADQWWFGPSAVGAVVLATVGLWRW